MGDQTGIEWTDATWNPTTGCTKVSPGCDHCYAKTLHERFNGPDSFETVTLHPERLSLPLRWRKPRRVFVNSMSDLFHQDIPDGFIAQVWDVMARCPQHTFQILTKRHARMRSWVSRWADRSGDQEADAASGMPPMPRSPEAVRSTYRSGRGQLFAAMLDSMGDPPEGAAYPLYDWMEGQRFWPTVLPNVWLGVSVEDQHWANIRIPALLETPAAVRFLSCEPLLGPIDLAGPLVDGAGPRLTYGPHIDWVIAGGESGPGVRPIHPHWARSLRDQCVASGVPFLFKQWGEWLPIVPDVWHQRRESDCLVRHDGRHWPLAEPNDQDDGTSWTVRRVGKKAAGRELDGRTWDEYPGGAW